MTPLLPLLLTSAIWSDLDRQDQLWDQNFGIGLRPEQLYLSRYSQSPAFDLYYRPWAELLRQSTRGGGISSYTFDKNNFKIALDVQQFKPEEVEVKLVDDFVVVKAKHEEKKDEHGFIQREFIRRYRVPERAEVDKLKSSISSDGVLIIEAPLLPEPEPKNEKTIKIELTGKPAEIFRETKEKDSEKEKPSSTTASAKLDAENEVRTTEQSASTTTA